MNRILILILLATLLAGCDRSAPPAYIMTDESGKKWILVKGGWDAWQLHAAQPTIPTK